MTAGATIDTSQPKRAWKAWTDDEYGFMEANATWTNRQLADALGRSRLQVEQKRRELRKGIVRMAEGVWSDEEDAIIRETPGLTSVQVAALLDRSVRSVEHRRSLLEVRSPINKDPFAAGARPLIAKTCPGCGLFLNAKWFMLEGTARTRRGENWSTHCRKCKWTRERSRPEPTEQRLAQIRATYHARQRVSQMTAEKHRDEYTEADHVVLADPDKTNLEKAITLKRTYSAVMGAVQKFDYRSRRGLGDISRDQWFIYFSEAP